MKKLYMKQKVFSLREKFTILDEAGHDKYFVEGSFLKLPKSFTISNDLHEKIGEIVKTTFSLLPKFSVEVNNREVLIIKKELSFFKARYTIEGQSIEVQGNWWDMTFQIMQNGELVGAVSKQWLSWGDSYEIQVIQESLEEVILSIVVAIDCVKQDARASSASN